MTLTESQKDALLSALTLLEANGVGTRSIKGPRYGKLVTLGLLSTVLGRSTAGGNLARWYVFTNEGLALARSLKGTSH